MNDFKKNNITLDLDNHEYKLINNPELVFTSVTTCIEYFFEGFDAQKIAKKLITNYPKYSQYTVESLIAEWNASADYGTRVHDEIEKWIKFGDEPNDRKAIHGKEWIERQFSKSDSDLFSEIIIYSEELAIAGTIDLIVKNNVTGEYDIFDWKTSKKIETISYGNKMGTHEVTKDVMDCNFYHYSLQLSLYRYILENYYNIKINRQYIAHLKNDGVDILPTSYMSNEIIAMLKSIKTKK